MTKSDSPLLKKSRENITKKKTLLGYTGIFTVFAALVFGVFFFSNGRSLILAPDGLSQHSVILGYYGEYLRTIIKNIFIEHTFVIPMFDFSIGLGNDIVSTLHYYAVGDPLNLFSVFVPVEYTDYLYSILAILRMYLSGLAFSFYMLHRNSHASAIVTGAFAYAFSGFCLRAATVHPFFMSGMMYAPLIFLGIDLILEKKSPVLYISAISLLLMTNFYFAYMTCIMMLVYAALRYFSVNKKAGFKVFLQTIGKFALFTVNGFLISMIIFLPQVANVLATDRLNVKHIVDVFFKPNYYEALFDAMTNPSIGSHWVAIGFTGISMLSLIVCVVRAKKHKNIVISFCLAFVAACLPVFGHVLNGFAYVTNRWIWIMTFIASVAVTVCYDELFDLSDKEKKYIWLVALAYIGVLCCMFGARSEVSFLMLTVMFAVLCLVTLTGNAGISKLTAQRILSLLLVASVFMQFTYRYDYREENQTRNYVLLGDFYDKAYSHTTGALINKVDDGSEFFRYDDYNAAINENASLLADTNSTSFYYSIANSNVSKFIQEVGINYPIEQRWLNFDQRYVLQMLSGCKYISGVMPFSKTLLFSRVDEMLTFQNQIALDMSNKSVSYYKGYFTHGTDESSTIKVNELEYALPMGYTYDSVMSREDYEKLTPIEKQNVLLQTAVTDDTDSLAKADIRTESVKQYDIFELIRSGAEVSEGIEIDGNNVIVTDPSATITVNVSVPDYSECYMSVDGLSFTEVSPYVELRKDLQEAIEKQQEAYDEEAAENPDVKADIADVDPISIKQLERAEKRYNNVGTVYMSAVSDLFITAGSLSYYTPSNQFYSGADTFAVYLGCSMFTEEGEEINDSDTITIRFSNCGTYNIEGWHISYQSLDYVEDDYTARTADVLENVEITNSENTVKGTITLDEAKILATQIPYSEGWTVTVDGEEAELLNINTMFCGVLLEPGEHTVEFNYATPYAGISLALTVIGIAGLIIIAIIWHKKEKNIAQ